MYSHCQGMRREGKRGDRTYRRCERVGDHALIGGKPYCTECAKREHARRDLELRGLTPLPGKTSEASDTDPVCPVQSRLL